MDTKAFYFRVGLFVFVIFFATISFLLWLGGKSLDDDRLPYDIYFTESITGLVPGTAVKYKGITVGSVEQMSIPRDNVEIIKIRARIVPEIAIKEDSMAHIEMQGITGGSFIQITGGSNEAKPLITTENHVAVIKTSPSTIESITESLPTLLHNLTDLSERLTLVFNDENITQISDTLTNFSKTALKAEKAATSLDLILSENRKPIQNFTNNTLVDISYLVNDLREMSKSIKETSESIEKNKGDFFFGSPNNKGVSID